MKHATREFAVDQLLRKGKLVDLYKAVREGIRISEPRYSIKNLETFYWKEKRAGGVTNAGESIVIYERWRETGEDGLLEQIRGLQRSRLSLDARLPRLAARAQATCGELVHGPTHRSGGS